MTEPTPARVLVVEDEPRLASLLVDYLKAAGHEPTWIDHGTRAMELLRSDAFDAVLLDLSLPGTDGLEVCRTLRRTSDVPVLMITARVEEIDRLVGLESGADDYICKPFSPREVVARVKAVLRRTRGKPAAPGPVHVDPASFTALYHGVPLDLTRIEFRLLQAFSQAPGRVFSRDLLLDKLYDDGRCVTDRTVDSHIRNLRRKLQAVTREDPIRSIYGVGYRWEA